MVQQKTKAKWVREGDQNTTFDDVMIKQRNCGSKTLSLQDDQGGMLIETSAISKHIIHHFHNFKPIVLGAV